MNCPRCKTADKFHQTGKGATADVFCVAKIGGKPCWYTLTHEQARIYFAEKWVNAVKKKRTEYFRLYYKEHRRKYKNGITLTQVAIIKKTSYQSVWNNLNKFDIIPGTHPVQIKFNNKLWRWMPKELRAISSKL